MSRANHVPQYRRHPNGQAFVTHRSVPTKSRRLYLGKYGTDESLTRYRQFIRRLELGQPIASIHAAVDRASTIAELVLAHAHYMREHYARPHGETSRELDDMNRALVPLVELYGGSLASDFGPRDLKLIQAALVKQDLARTYVNAQIGRIKRFFRWAASEDLVPRDLHHALQAVAGLRHGQSGARETEPVRPALMADVAALLPFLTPTVAALVQVQYYCGMRPGEACRMRQCDIDRSRSIWLYAPAKHKNSWRGKSLVKGIPVVAQQLLEPLIVGRDSAAYLFSPAEAATQAIARRIAAAPPRTTKRYPCETARVEAARAKAARRPRKRPLRECYDAPSYGHALKYGFAAAKKAGVAIARFTPNQLRHAILNFISAELGEQKAQRYAGHENLETTAIYTETEVREIIAIAKQLDERWAAQAT